MPRYLVDANLPYYFSLWRTEKFIHQYDLGDTWTDRMIWDYAKEHHLTIITKDTDFYNLILISEPPPKVIHIKLGNLRTRELFHRLNAIWEIVLNYSESSKLVVVYADRIEYMT